MTNPNIPPEIADERIATWVTKIIKARHDNDSTRFDEQVLTGCDLMRRAAPAPVRISPEVRETILGILRPRAESERRWATSINPHFDDYRAAWKKVNDVDAAIAFVEALP